MAFCGFHAARWPAAFAWMDCRARLTGTGAWVASLGHRCPQRRGQGELMAKNGNWTNCSSSSISANFKITLEVIEVCTSWEGTSDCFLKTFPCMHMSAVSSTSTLSCRSVLRWPVLIEGNQEGVMLKAGFWRIMWMGGQGWDPANTSEWVLVWANHSCVF